MISNLTKKNIISHKTWYTRGVYQRGRGMLGRTFDDFDAMVFERCNSVHTLFMSISLDIIFIDREHSVCELHRAVPPWRFCVHSKQGKTVIELPVGVIEKTNIEVGDFLDLNAEAVKANEQKKVSQELPLTINTVLSYNEEREL